MMLDPRVLTLNLEQMLLGEEANRGKRQVFDDRYI